MEILGIHNERMVLLLVLYANLDESCGSSQHYGGRCPVPKSKPRNSQDAIKVPTHVSTYVPTISSFQSLPLPSFVFCHTKLWSDLSLGIFIPNITKNKPVTD